MSSYCTFFDRGYLAQGLALWHSLRRHEPDATLRVLALDDETESILRQLASPGLRVMALAELLAADPPLAAARADRTRQEFVFALKPCFCRHVLRDLSATGVLVYLDADVFFFRAPGSICDELGERSVLVVPHRFPPGHDDSARYGCFNAGLLAFRRNATGEACLDRWREQCLASSRVEAGGATYGDQKYLDEWPARYGAKVCVSRNPGLNLAPWNWAGQACQLGPLGVQVGREPLVAFHFAQFRRISARWFDSGQMEYGIMPLRLRSRLYGDYWAALGAAEAELRRVRPEFALSNRTWANALGPWHLALLRFSWGQFWFRLGPWWLSGRLGLGRFSGRVMAKYRRWQGRLP